MTASRDRGRFSTSHRAVSSALNQGNSTKSPILTAILPYSLQPEWHHTCWRAFNWVARSAGPRSPRSHESCSASERDSRTYVSLAEASSWYSILYSHALRRFVWLNLYPGTSDADRYPSWTGFPAVLCETSSDECLSALQPVSICHPRPRHRLLPSIFRVIPR